MKPAIIKQNVGNDISKETFKVCFQQLVMSIDETPKGKIKATRTFKNTLNGFKSFHEWIEKKRDKSVSVRITLEATGVYHEQLVYFLHDQTDYHLSVILPNNSKAFAKSLNLKTKTDKTDAEMLGKMGLERDLPKWKPLSSQLRNLKALCRERNTLLEYKTMIMNRMHAHNHSYQGFKPILNRLKRQLKNTKKLIEEVEKEICQLIKNDSILKERIDNVCTIKGVGLITAATIVGETDGFALFTSSKQVVSFSGYDVTEYQSGSSIKGKTRISKKGNRHIRRALHFPAMTAVKHVEELDQLNQRVFDRTKIKMKGYVAVQRKLLVLIYTLFKKNQPYEANFKQKEDMRRAKEKLQNQNCRQDLRPAYSE